MWRIGLRVWCSRQDLYHLIQYVFLLIKWDGMSLFSFPLWPKNASRRTFVFLPPSGTFIRGLLGDKFWAEKRLASLACGQLRTGGWYRCSPRLQNSASIEFIAEAKCVWHRFVSSHLPFYFLDFLSVPDVNAFNKRYRLALSPIPSFWWVKTVLFFMIRTAHGFSITAKSLCQRLFSFIRPTH